MIEELKEEKKVSEVQPITHTKSSHRKWLWIALAVVGAVAIFSLGLVVGKAMDLEDSITSEDGTIQIQKVLQLYSKTRSSEVRFDQYWDIWDKIKEKHVAQEVEDVDLFYSSLQGLVAGLNDPYSVYFPPKQAEEFAKDLAGEFDGIGAEIGLKDGGQLTVIAPLPSSPAEKAGLKPGDKIFAIDGLDTRYLTLEEAVQKIRGKKGTTVVLTITHNGYGTIEEVSVVRDKIVIPTVEWKMLDGGIAYMQIRYFNEETWVEFDKAVRGLLNQSPVGIVLDLRSNPGGFLQTSVDVASEWVERGPIVSEIFADNEKNIHTTRGSHRLANLKTVILVDGGTASGSEIVAGALKDNDKATLVGQKTFGKGSVQDFEILSDGSALKLTVAKWFTPNDTAIDGEGITPDIILDEMVQVISEDEIKDLALEKALQLFK